MTMDKRVFLAGCGEYTEEQVFPAVHRVLEGFGGAEAFGVAGKKVLIKANLLSAHRPEEAVTTHPLVIEALCREFIAAGAEVTVADSPGGPFNETLLRRCYRTTGMEEAARKSGAKLNFDTSHRRVDGGGEYCRSFELLNAVLDADLVVSAAKLKTHGLAYYTGAVKNLYGCIPGLDKAAMHAAYSDKRVFNRVLVDLCEVVKPGFSLVDGVIGMEGPGPSGGTPKFAGVIGGATNPYALDLAMCGVAMLPASLVPVLGEAAARGLAPADERELEYIGEAPDAYRTEFKPATGSHRSRGSMGFFASFVLPRGLREAIRDRRSPYPVIQQNCVGCGRCAEICPRGAISVADGRAKVRYDDCIRCYCCHEMCPARAIELKRGRPHD